MEPIDEIFEIYNCIQNEKQAFEEDLVIFNEVYKYYNQTSDVYYLLNKCYDRPWIDPALARQVVNHILKGIHLASELWIDLIAIEKKNTELWEKAEEEKRKNELFDNLKKKDRDDIQLLENYLHHHNEVKSI